MAQLIGTLALIVMFAAFVVGASSENEAVQALGYGLTLAMMPVSACAWMASIAFPQNGPTSRA